MWCVWGHYHAGKYISKQILHTWQHYVLQNVQILVRFQSASIPTPATDMYPHTHVSAVVLNGATHAFGMKTFPLSPTNIPDAIRCKLVEL